MCEYISLGSSPPTEKNDDFRVLRKLEDSLELVPWHYWQPDGSFDIHDQVHVEYVSDSGVSRGSFDCLAEGIPAFGKGGSREGVRPY